MVDDPFPEKIVRDIDNESVVDDGGGLKMAEPAVDGNRGELFFEALHHFTPEFGVILNRGVIHRRSVQNPFLILASQPVYIQGLSDMIHRSAYGRSGEAVHNQIKTKKIEITKSWAIITNDLPDCKQGTSSSA